MLGLASRRRQVLPDRVERLLRQIHRRRSFRQTKVELLGQIQFLLLLQKDDFVDLVPCPVLLAVADGLLRSQQVGVCENLGRQLRDRQFGAQEHDGGENFRDQRSHGVSPGLSDGRGEVICRQKILFRFPFPTIRKGFFRGYARDRLQYSKNTHDHRSSCHGLPIKDKSDQEHCTHNHAPS